MASRPGAVTLAAQPGIAMNHDHKSHPALSRLVAAAVLVLLLSGNGCGRKNAQSAPQSSDQQEARNTPSATTPKPAVVPAEKTSFNEVTAQLDPGGSLYGYLTTSQWLEGLSDRTNGWRGAALSLPNAGAGEKSNVNKAFDLITRLIRNSGLESINGVGVSGIALEKGFYQTKFVVGRDTNSAPGGIWTAFGRAPRPLHELDWLPAHTVGAGFSDVDFVAIWNAIVQAANGVGFSARKAGHEPL